MILLKEVITVKETDRKHEMEKKIVYSFYNVTVTFAATKTLNNDDEVFIFYS